MQRFLQIFGASLSILDFHLCNVFHEYLSNECLIKVPSSSHHIFDREGLAICLCKKRGILQPICCNIILVGLKIRPPATPPAQLGSCQRGRTLPCVVRPLKYPSPYFFPIRPACHVPLENEQLIAHFLWTLIFEKTSTFRHSDNEIKNLSGRS